MDEKQERRNFAIYLRRLANDIEMGKYNTIEAMNEPLVAEPDPNEHYIWRDFHLGYKLTLEVRY